MKLYNVEPWPLSDSTLFGHPLLPQIFRIFIASLGFVSVGPSYSTLVGSEVMNILMG